MAASYIKYCKSIARQFNYYANWMPGTPRQIGDVGFFDRRFVFRKVAHLSNLDINFKETDDPSPTDFEYQSQKGVSVSIDFGSNAVAETASGKLKYEFSASGAFVFKVSGARIKGIEDLYGLSQDVENSLQSGVWRPEWNVITELCVAEGVSVLISSSKSGKLELGFTGSLSKIPDIADVNAGLTMTHQSDMSTSIVGQGPMSPLFRVHGFKARRHSRGAQATGTLEPLGGEDADDLQFTISEPELLYAEADEE